LLLVSAVLAISACSLYTGGSEHTSHITGPDAGTTDHDGGCGGALDGGGYDVDGGGYGGPDGGIYDTDGGYGGIDAGGYGGNDGGGYSGPDAGFGLPDAH
jgi:hypothetical protein